MNINVGKKSGEKRELLLQNKLGMWLFPFCHVFFFDSAVDLFKRKSTLRSFTLIFA